MFVAGVILVDEVLQEEAGQVCIKSHLGQGLELVFQDELVPSCVLCQAVVGDNVGFALCVVQVLHEDAGDFGHALPPGGLDAAVPGDDVVLAVDHHRVEEAEFADAGLYLLELFVGVGARVVDVGDEQLDGYVHHPGWCFLRRLPLSLCSCLYLFAQ